MEEFWDVMFKSLSISSKTDALTVILNFAFMDHY